MPADQLLDLCHGCHRDLRTEETEVAKLQDDRSAAQQKAGLAEGVLQEMRTRFQQQAEELRSLRTINTEGKTHIGLLEQDLTACRDKIAELERELNRWKRLPVREKAATTPRKRTRKATV